MRINRPAWMEPVDSFGEWVGLIGGGLLIVALVVVVIFFWPFGHGPGAVAHDIVQVPHVAAEVACGFDATDPCNWSIVRVRNDTRAPVRLEPCDHHGGKGDHCGEPILVRPGRISPAGQYDGIAAETGGYTWVAVVSGGHRLGCLVVDGHRTKRDGYLVLVSEAGRCGNPDSHATKPVGRIHV